MAVNVKHKDVGTSLTKVEWEATDTHTITIPVANGDVIRATAKITEALLESAVDLKHTTGTDTALGTLGTKNPPIDDDKVIYRDSTASDALVTSTWTQVKAFLKTYWDTLYAAVAHAATHTNGTDDIQSATAAQKGLATSTQITKLDGIEAGATKYPDTGEQAFLDADHSKLDGIEASAVALATVKGDADIADAISKKHSQNTDSDLDATFEATFTKNADTNVKANGWVIDEDNMVSNLDTKVPTQQSVKAYVDANAGGGSGEANFYKINLPDAYGIFYDDTDGTVWIQTSRSDATFKQLLAQGFIHDNRIYMGIGAEAYQGIKVMGV